MHGAVEVLEVESISEVQNLKELLKDTISLLLAFLKNSRKCPRFSFQNLKQTPTVHYLSEHCSAYLRGFSCLQTF